MSIGIFHSSRNAVVIDTSALVHGQCRIAPGFRPLTVVMASLLTLASLAAAATAFGKAPAKPKKPGNKATIAVLDFSMTDSNKSPYRSRIKTDLLTTKINTALVSSRRFDVVERRELDAVLTEGTFSRSRLADPRTAVALGNMLGAAYLVLGDISVMSADARKTRIPYVETWKAEIQGTIVLDYRVINVRTAKIEKAGKVESRLQQTVHLQSADSSAEPTDLFFEDLQRDAAERIASRIVSALFPIRVAMVDGSTVYINVGEGTGIQPRDRLIVYDVGKEIFDPDTGESLGATERPIAAIEIESVEAKRSTASITAKKREPVTGMICRQGTQRDFEDLAPLPPNEP